MAPGQQDEAEESSGLVRGRDMRLVRVKAKTPAFQIPLNALTRPPATRRNPSYGPALPYATLNAKGCQGQSAPAPDRGGQCAFSDGQSTAIPVTSSPARMNAHWKRIWSRTGMAVRPAASASLRTLA